MNRSMGIILGTFLSGCVSSTKLLVNADINSIYSVAETEVKEKCPTFPLSDYSPHLVSIMFWNSWHEPIISVQYKSNQEYHIETRGAEDGRRLETAHTHRTIIVDLANNGRLLKQDRGDVLLDETGYIRYSVVTIVTTQEQPLGEKGHEMEGPTKDGCQ